MTETKVCRVCGVELSKENWSPSRRKDHGHICKECDNKRHLLRKEANPGSAKAIHTRHNRKKGHRPFNENKECALFLGVHIAEQVLSKAFKDVEVMPYGNPGYDFICNHNKMIDIKSSCIRKRYEGWTFTIKRNTIADYFLCLAFDNREDLNPLHAWLLPGHKFNHLTGATISQSTIHKWDAYRLDLSKIAQCCDAMR